MYSENLRDVSDFEGHKKFKIDIEKRVLDDDNYERE